MFSKLVAVAGNCFLETIRQPIFMTLVAATIAMLLFCPEIVGFTLISGSDQKLLRDLCLSTLLFGGLFLAAFSAASVLSREIENRTVLTVVSKPVGRGTFLLGKYLGVAAAMAVAFYLTGLVMLLIVRHKSMETASDEYDQPVLLFGGVAILLAILIAGACNFLYRMHFPSTVVVLAVPLMTLAVIGVCFVSPDWTFQPFGTDFADGQLIAAAACVFLILLILAAVAVVASTRLGPVMTLMAAALFLVLGLSGSYLLAPYRDTNLLAALGYKLLPHIQYLWLADHLTEGFQISAAYVAQTVLYAVLWVAAILSLGVALFQTRQVG